MQIGLSQECCLFCLFCLKSSLWSSDLPCLLATAILNSFSLFYLPNIPYTKLFLRVHFSQTFSISVPITVIFDPKKPLVSQAYFLFPSQNAISFLIPFLPKTHFLLPLSNQKLIFISAFYRLVSINTSDYF